MGNNTVRYEPYSAVYDHAQSDPAVCMFEHMRRNKGFRQILLFDLDMLYRPKFLNLTRSSTDLMQLII